jgi:hypothetical protein
MTLILNGSVGVSDVDGSAATPAIRGTDANTGMFFPAADTIAFGTSGAERMRVNSNGEVTVNGTTTGWPAAGRGLLTINGTSSAILGFSINGGSNGYVFNDGTSLYLNATPGSLIFQTSGNERARIDSSGIITAPYQTAFYAYAGGTQSFSGAQSTVVVQFNVQNSIGVRSTGYNTSTYRFTAPVSGAYLLCSRIVNTTSGSTGPELIFRVNGSVAYYAAINYANNAYVTTSGQLVVYLNASDYVEACIINNNSTSFTLDLTRSNFCGFLIG